MDRRQVDSHMILAFIATVYETMVGIVPEVRTVFVVLQGLYSIGGRANVDCFMQRLNVKRTVRTYGYRSIFLVLRCNKPACQQS